MKLEIGVQSFNIVHDENPAEGFELMKKAGFDCCDFSLNRYMKNNDIYEEKNTRFFDKSVEELKEFFTPHKEGAKKAGIRIHQMHMPYPLFVPGAKDEFNDYLRDVVAKKSLEVCHFLDCKYIVVHGFKIAHYYGSEEAEWEEMRKFLEAIAPLAKEYGITMCMENLYGSLGSRHVEGPGCDAVKAAARIDAMNEKFGAEVLGFCYDTGHGNLTGLDPYRFITTLGKRLKLLHMHENDGIADLHQIPYTFTRFRENRSILGWEGVLAALGEVGFDKVLNFETGPVLGSFPTELKGDALHMLCRIGCYFSDQIDLHRTDK
ncbi:MAG: sugar phosphate isomerase/epimerase [Butyrivibrio sp.]|nr:sugar phosphate isomerase/epimerase [Butyrivibrio sp.]